MNSKELIDTFGNRLLEYRLENSLSLSDLSKKVGIPAQTLNRYELGQRTPKVDIAIKIAENLNIDPLWLQGYEVDAKEIFGEKHLVDIKDFIKKRRIDLGLSKEELAKKIGVPEATITRWESGHIKDMDRKRMMALAVALSLSPNILIRWDQLSREELSRWIKQTKKETSTEREKRILGYNLSRLIEINQITSTELKERFGLTESIIRKWYTYREQHGIASSIHEMRHTMISVAKADMPEQLLKRMAGHSKSMDTFGVYGHDVDGEMERAAEILDATYRRILE